MTVQERLYTTEDLCELSHNENAGRYELSRGVLVEMSPTGDMHGTTSLWLGHLILVHVDTNDLGEVTGAETGIILLTDPDTVRTPDVGFIAKARLTPMTGKYYPIAPDLAVEVVSPGDTAKEIRQKVAEFLAAGTRMVWIVYPDSRLVDVYRPGRATEIFKDEDVLDGGDVLPGFRLPVRDVFKKLR